MFTRLKRVERTYTVVFKGVDMKPAIVKGYEIVTCTDENEQSGQIFISGAAESNETAMFKYEDVLYISEK